jgi:transposase-like protein
MSTRSARADRWRKIIQQQRRSDLSVAAFCRRAGVSQPAFYAWRQRLRAGVTFAEVKLPRETTIEAGGIELRLPGRRSLVVRPGFDGQTLLELLHILETTSVDLSRGQADAGDGTTRRADA